MRGDSAGSLGIEQAERSIVTAIATAISGFRASGCFGMSSLSSLGVKNALAIHVFDTFRGPNEALSGKGGLVTIRRDGV